MAWLLGRFSKLKSNQDFSPPQKPVFTFKDDRNIVFGGGESLIHKFDDENKFIVCGTGIDVENELIMQQADWTKAIRSGEIINSEGHYLVTEISDKNVCISNDKLGLREVFLYEDKTSIYYSTRLDLLLPYIKDKKINLEFLCSYWNLQNPLIYETFLKNVQILGPFGEAEISESGIKLKRKKWIPEIFETSPNEAIIHLSRIVKSVFNSNRCIDLGLSGGIDSRTLLSMFIHYDKNLWQTHTFGNADSIDFRIGSKISEKLQLNKRFLSKNKFENGNELDNWQEFVKETLGFLPAYAYHELSYYKLLDKKHFMIDGGKGEYIRRGLSNRLAFQGKRALLNNNVQLLKQYFICDKPKIFYDHIFENQDSLLDSQISGLLESMPNAKEFGTENWVDLYNVRYRTGMSGFASQTRLDGIIANCMPFIQPSLLNYIFNLQPKVRMNEIINRKIISRNKILKHFPLARYSTIIPYQHNKFTSLAFGKIISKFVKETNNDKIRFINFNKDYALSRVSEIGFVNSSLYNSKKIANEVSKFFDGKSADTELIIWWMTFDVWHKLIFEGGD